MKEENPGLAFQNFTHELKMKNEIKSMRHYTTGTIKQLDEIGVNYAGLIFYRSICKMYY